MKTKFAPIPARGGDTLHFSVPRSTNDMPDVWPQGELHQWFELRIGGKWQRFGAISASGGIAIDEQTGQPFVETTHYVPIPGFIASTLARAVVESDALHPSAKFEVK